MKHPKDDRPASEHDVGVGEAAVHHDADDLHRALKPRQVDMLAIAGAIGTGLIIGSGSGLAHGGPASLLIAYVLIGAVVYFVMTAMGEMATWLPMKKGFAGYATRFVDPAFGYVPTSVEILFMLTSQLRDWMELLLQIRHRPAEQPHRYRNHPPILAA